VRLPLMISVTITDRSGRTLSGQTSRPSTSRSRTRGRSASASTAPSARATCAPTWRSCRGSPTLRQLLPERRPAQRLRRVRRDAGARPAGCCASSPERLRQHRRRLLRHHARSHPRHRARPWKAWPRARSPSAEKLPARTALQRGSSRSRPARLQLPDDRRAHQRHRLEVRAADPRGDYAEAVRWRSTRCAAAPTSSTSTWTRACSTPSRP
jgi:hypothetical protein